MAFNAGDGVTTKRRKGGVSEIKFIIAMWAFYFGFGVFFDVVSS
jgi:hypothetical protein